MYHRYFYDLIENTLDLIWKNANKNNSATERDFLRELHGPWGINKLGLSINNDLSEINKFVSLTSVWVDHTPQCWTGYDINKNIWKKPSCELADLLIIVWTDETKVTGRALLIQGKVGDSPTQLDRSISTKKELELLENSKKFLLSNATHSKKDSSPQPYSKSCKSIFDLKSLAKTKEEIIHSRFLQIRSKKAKKWDNEVSKWNIFWPSKKNSSVEYSRMIAEMVIDNSYSLGVKFTRNKKDCDWDRLINLLIDSTLKSSGGTAKGNLQNTFNYNLINEHLYLLNQKMDIKSHRRDYANIDIPNVDSNDESDPENGIPILFVTPIRE